MSSTIQISHNLIIILWILPSLASYSFSFLFSIVFIKRIQWPENINLLFERIMFRFLPETFEESFLLMCMIRLCGCCEHGNGEKIIINLYLHKQYYCPKKNLLTCIESSMHGIDSIVFIFLFNFFFFFFNIRIFAIGTFSYE